MGLLPTVICEIPCMPAFDATIHLRVWTVNLTGHSQCRRAEIAQSLYIDWIRAERPGSIPGRARYLFTSQSPDRLQTSRILFSGYRRLFSLGQSGRAVELTTHFYPVPRSRMVALYLHAPYVFTVCCLINKVQGKLWLYLCQYAVSEPLLRVCHTMRRLL
jgi:hypothetical protein